jgi:hypothetical protein
VLLLRLLLRLRRPVAVRVPVTERTL